MKKSEMRQIVLVEMSKNATNRTFEIEDIYQASSYKASGITFEFVAETIEKVLAFQAQGQQQFDNRLESVRINGATAYKFVK